MNFPVATCGNLDSMVKMFVTCTCPRIVLPLHGLSLKGTRELCFTHLYCPRLVMHRRINDYPEFRLVVVGGAAQ
jgi:hypothetical protein